MARPPRLVPQPPLALSPAARRRLRGLARAHGLSEAAALSTLLETLDRLGPAHRLGRALDRAAAREAAREAAQGAAGAAAQQAGRDPGEE